jgi:RNA polymerase sporulation-specific sigma factor
LLGPFKKYYSNFSEQDDLISIGTIGLIKAVNTLDGSKGIRLSSYTAGCIENEVLMYFRFSQKSSQDISINEPIDTDKDGNTLMLMDTSWRRKTIFWRASIARANLNSSSTT